MIVKTQQEQLDAMMNIASAAWPIGYEQVREIMFRSFDEQHGRGRWTFETLDEQQVVEFEKWLEEE